MRLFTIIIEDYTLEVIIGLLEEERKNRQKIVVNAEITYDIQEHFLDYVQAVEVIKNLLEYKRYDTLENALEGICKALKTDFEEIKKIKLRIDKPSIFKEGRIGVMITKVYE